MQVSNAIAVLFDVDGTLISSGGAGAASWRLAFDDLYGIPADIGKFTDAGMTEPEVGRLTFKNVIGHEPSRTELARVMSRRLRYLPADRGRVEGLPGAAGRPETLDRLDADGYLLGITTGGMEAAAHIKLARANLAHYFSFGGYGSDSGDRTELTRKALERAGTLLGEPLDPRRRSSWATRPTTSTPRTAPAPSRWGSRPATSPRTSCAMPAPTTYLPRSRRSFRSRAREVAP